MAGQTTSIQIGELCDLALKACRACGAGEAMAASLVRATLSAELAGRHEVGFAHLVDYLDSLRAGRISGGAEPVLTHPAPAFIHVEAKGGIAQLGFDRAFDDLCECARSFGIAILTQAGSYTAGEMGYYVRRLAEAGLVGLAFANAHAMVSPVPGVTPVYGTNPLAFAAPTAGEAPPLLFDQSTSATAFVNVARAAAEGHPIPEGWVVDANGQPTTDAAKAAALLPAGGRKGANLALMVEVLSAGLAGASWSLDAGHFREGARSPAIGMTVIAILPGAAAPGFAGELAGQVSRLAGLGVHVPGARAFDEGPDEREITIDSAVLSDIRAAVHNGTAASIDPDPI